MIPAITQVSRKSFIRAAKEAVRTSDATELRRMVGLAQVGAARCALLNRSSAIMRNLGAALSGVIRSVDDCDALLRAFFDAGASPDTKNSDGQTLLDYALFVGGAQRASTIMLLLERGADVACSGHYGTPYLVKAASYHSEKVVATMLERGAPVNAVEDSASGKPGFSALHVAVDWARPTIVQILLKAGADPHLPSPKGTPLEMAIAAIEYGGKLSAEGLARRQQCVALLEEARAP
jgi:ankyrin repeat protein